MEESKEISITNQFPADKFNLLIPVETMQEVSPLHKIIINKVLISSDLKDKDVYKQGSELALTKKGLAKLMTASNIQVIPEESGPVLPTVCRKCTEVAKATKLAPRCGDCPSKNDVAFKVTIAAPDPTGSPRYFQASKNSIYGEAKSATEKQFLNEQCETKALNRALRGAMMIKSTYTAKELEKPFVVAVTVANMADEDLKKAMIAKYTESSALLFGNKPDNKMIAAPEDIEIIPDDEPEDDIPVMDAEIVTDPKETPPEPDPEPEVLTCEKCGKPIVAGSGKWTVENIIEWSQKHTKKNLCLDCCNEISKKKAGGK